MAKTTNTKATVNTKNTKSQEDKTMAKTNTKAVKEVKEAKVKTVNEAKVNYISIEEITAMYSEMGIKCGNPTAKGNYRIMGSKSSLNLKPKKGYYIYSTDDDFENVSKAGIKNADLIVEKGTNSQDKTRPNTIICQTVETLKELLKVYATNPLNQIATETK